MKVKFRILGALVLAQALAANAQVPKNFGSKPTLDEEFSGESLNGSVWQSRGLGVRNHCIDTEHSVSVHGGFATITTYSSMRRGKPTNYCGMISTENSFNQKYGYWEASVRFHAVPGFQCAFWVQSSKIGSILGDAKRSGTEMDVFEHLSHAQNKEFDHAIHWDGYGEAHKHVVSNLELNSLDDGQFHVFGMAWSPAGYTFYVDGKVTYNVPPSQVPVAEIPEYIILSTEVPRAFPAEGFGSMKDSRATFDIDYVRVYPYQPSKSQNE